jgi:hypothetical protein
MDNLESQTTLGTRYRTNKNKIKTKIQHRKLETFPDPFLIDDYTRFVTRLTRRLPLAEQELLILPEHLSSPRF